jgi:hypothetical protein
VRVHSIVQRGSSQASEGMALREELKGHSIVQRGSSQASEGRALLEVLKGREGFIRLCKGAAVRRARALREELKGGARTGGNALGGFGGAAFAPTTGA